VGVGGGPGPAPRPRAMCSHTATQPHMALLTGCEEREVDTGGSGRLQALLCTVQQDTVLLLLLLLT
jgi:hypothetical protein